MATTVELGRFEAIIFDLGGVILNVSYQATIDRLSALAGRNVAKLYSQADQVALFDSFEMGDISPAAFRDGLRQLLEVELSDEQIDEAWNAMLLDLPIDKVRFVEAVAEQRRTFLLSNTNAIHIPAFNHIVDETLGAAYGGIAALFDEVYYSFEMGDRKPNPTIFKRVIAEQNLDPEKTLFIDDSIQHVRGARGAGLNAHHLLTGDTLLPPAAGP